MFAFVASFLVSTGITVSSAPAFACSPIYCFPGEFVPADGATIPAGILQLPFSVASGPGFLDQTVESMLVQLTTAADEPVAFEVIESDRGIFLKVDLDPQTDYRIRWMDPCLGSGYPNGWQVDRTFHTGQALPIPTLSAIVRVGEIAEGTGRVGTSSGSCTAEVPAAVVPIRLELPADLLPFLPLLGVTAKLDSWPIATGWNYGKLPSLDDSGLVLVDTPWTRCGDPNPPDPGVPPYVPSPTSVHSVSYRLSLPGAQDAWASPIDITFQLGCDLIHVQPEPTPDDADVPVAPEASAPDAIPDAGSDDVIDGSEVATTPVQGSGCQAGGDAGKGGTSGGLPPLLMFATFIVLRFVRTRLNGNKGRRTGTC